MLRTLAVLGLSLLTTLPAHAVLCTGAGPGVGASLSVEFGEGLSDEDRNRLDLMALRRMGVDATGVERWGSCLRAFVRKPEGGEEMQYFDPETYERVQ